MKIIKKIINLFYQKQRVRLSKKQTKELMSEVRKAFPQDRADSMDYDGMGNYGRFPPQK